jgi:outer membrane immunogenic protein
MKVRHSDRQRARHDDTGISRARALGTAKQGNHMTNFIRNSLAAVAITALPFAAQAADLRAPIYKAPEPTFSWTGFYIGANAGISVGRDRTTDTGVYSAPALPASVTLYNESFSHAPIGAVAGGQIGYNWQVAPSWVFGLEVDGQWSGQKETSCLFGCGATTAAFFGPGGGGFNNFLSDEQKLRWFATGRARLGYATNTWLLYVTGGAAGGEVQSNLSLTSNNVVGTLFTPGTSIASLSKTKLGWTIGGGAEMRLWGGWSTKVEYLYVDLGNFTNTFAIPAGTALPGAAFTTTSAFRFTDHIVRAGLNYRFGG